uniref:Uncharacterized protein n=1 Tax=Oryza nivara TaxID=4536 RepID=A0A0E0G7S0_ORYNI
MVENKFVARALILERPTPPGEEAGGGLSGDGGVLPLRAVCGAGPSLVTSVYETHLDLAALSWTRTSLGLSLRAVLRLSSPATPASSLATGVGIYFDEDTDEETLAFLRGTRRFSAAGDRLVDLAWALTRARFPGSAVEPPPCRGAAPQPQQLCSWNGDAGLFSSSSSSGEYRWTDYVDVVRACMLQSWRLIFEHGSYEGRGRTVMMACYDVETLFLRGIDVNRPTTPAAAETTTARGGAAARRTRSPARPPPTACSPSGSDDEDSGGGGSRVPWPGQGWEQQQQEGEEKREERKEKKIRYAANMWAPWHSDSKAFLTLDQCRAGGDQSVPPSL